MSAISSFATWRGLISDYERTFSPSSQPDNYIIFVMNQTSLKARTGQDYNSFMQLMTPPPRSKISAIVVPDYSEEADNMIEGHLRQMMRLKEMIKVKCASTSPWKQDNFRSPGIVPDPVKKYLVDSAGYYAKERTPIEKRCDPKESLAARAQKYFVVSTDKDFQAIFKELKSTGSVLGSITIYEPDNVKNFTFDDMFANTNNRFTP